MPSYRPLDEPVAGYKLLALLGEGAFGQVWKAEAPGGVPVAVKVTAKLNGIHAIREWQSLQAVKHLTHPNLVNIHGVWLRDESGHVLSTDEVRALIPAEAPTQEPPMPAPQSTSRRSPKDRPPKVDPLSSTLRCETLQVSESTSPAPLDSPRSETSSPSGTDSGSGAPVSDTGSNDSAGSAGAGSAGSRERWARLGDSIPPLELITAMTLGDGTLLDRMQRCKAMGHKGIPRPELMSYMRDAVKGLSYLNNADVQHCDIKPENLLVVGDSVQVCDYGSALRSIYAAEARRLHGDSPSAAAFAAPTARAMTNQGYTVQYAAPEQLGAKRIKLHKTTDLYALAMTYYALRTGKFPWSDDADEPIEKLKYDEHFDFEALDKLNRYGYEREVLRRALRRDPKQRQQTVTDFYSELQRAIDQEAAAEQAARRRRRQIAGWSAVAVLLVALTAAGVYYKDRLLSGFSRGDRDEFRALLAQDQWKEANQLIDRSDQLVFSDEETGQTWKELKEKLHLVALQDGGGAVAKRAKDISEKLTSKLADGALDEFLMAELGSGIIAAAKSDPAGAAKNAREIEADLPPDVNRHIQQGVAQEWLAAVRNEDHSIAAVELATIAQALPEARSQVHAKLDETIRNGIVKAAEELSTPGTTLTGVAEQCERLAKVVEDYAAAASSETDAGIRQLGHQAGVLHLAARVQNPLQDPADPQAVAEQAEALRAKIANGNPSDRLELTQLDLIRARATTGDPLDPNRIHALAKIGQRRAALQAATSTWDASLYRELVDKTLEAAVASLDKPDQGFSEELLTALRSLPADGNTDLRLAKTLVARAMKEGKKESPTSAHAAKWLADAVGTQDPDGKQGYDALAKWHALIGEKLPSEVQLGDALQAILTWRDSEGSTADSLADDVARQLREDIRSRAARLNAGDPAALVAIASRVHELAAAKKPDASPAQASAWQMAADLHAVSARWLGLNVKAKDDYKQVQRELDQLTNARDALAAAGMMSPLDVELAALTVESYLETLQPGAKPASPLPLQVEAAWKRLHSALADDADPAPHRPYLDYVVELGRAAGLPGDAASAATESALAIAPDAQSPWFRSPHRRSAVKDSLVKRALASFPPLPTSLQYRDDASGQRFREAAQTLELARQWDDKSPVVSGLLAVCRMYAQAAPHDWKAIGELTAMATSDPQFLAAFDGLEPKSLGMHVWLAHARALGASAADANAKLAAASAYAATLRAGGFDPYGERGQFITRESALACYDQIVVPALAQLPSDAASLANNPRAEELSLLYGAQGALLEGRFFGPIANQHFDYPADSLAYQRAARDAFATAAMLEAHPALRLRWYTGEARAVDSLMSGGDEEQQHFRRLAEIAAATARDAAWKTTFESHNLQALLHHYESRRSNDQAAQAKALEAAAKELNLALTAHQTHERKGSPWVDSWLAQTHEEISRVALEQAWPTPRGKRRLELLQLSVAQAKLAARVPSEHRLAPASCYFCAGNALEDLALYMRFRGYFQPAEEAFKDARRAALGDAFWQHKADVYLGRLWVKQCLEDPQVRGSPPQRVKLRDQAIEVLTTAAKGLESAPSWQSWLTREAEFYLAEAERELFPSTMDSDAPDADKLRSAEDRYRKLADTPGLGAEHRLNYLLEAAATAEMSADAEATSRLESFLVAIDKVVATHNDPEARARLVELRFGLIDLQGSAAARFPLKAQVAKTHLDAIEPLVNPAATIAKKDIFLRAGRARCDTAEGLSTRQAMLDQCRSMLTAAAIDEGDREVYRIDVLTAQTMLDWERAQAATDKKVKEKYVVDSVAAAEEAVQRARQLVANHQVTLRMTPDDEPPNSRSESLTRFDERHLTLEARGQTVYAAAIAVNLPNSALIKARVKALWEEVDLAKIPRNEGGPTDDQKDLYIKFVSGK